MDSQHSTLELAVRSRTQSAAEVREAGALSTPVSLWRPSHPGCLDPTCPCLPETINPLGSRLCYSVYWGRFPFRKSIRSKLFLQQASLMAQMVKNLPDNARDPGSIPFLFPRDPSRKDPLEKEMATRSSILAWEISWTEEPSGLQDHKESDMTEQLTLSLSYFNNNTKTLVFCLLLLSWVCSTIFQRLHGM